MAKEANVREFERCGIWVMCGSIFSGTEEKVKANDDHICNGLLGGMLAEAGYCRRLL